MAELKSSFAATSRPPATRTISGLLAAAAVLCYALYRFLTWFTTPIRAASARAALEAEDRRARETWLAASKTDAVHLSVVIPAYNERERLPVMLREAAAYLSAQSFAFEVLVVDDELIML